MGCRAVIHMCMQVTVVSVMSGIVRPVGCFDILGKQLLELRCRGGKLGMRLDKFSGEKLIGAGIAGR